MKTVLILKGLPASGKSTFARDLLNNSKGNWKRFNKDELRLMLTDNHHTKSNERFVERMRDLMLVEALKEGKHVLIDDTNLSERPVERIRNVVREYTQATGDEVNIEIRELDAALDECIERDKQHEKKVGEDVIVRMYRQHVLGDVQGPNYKPQDTGLPEAILCDLDGTLAILKRPAYNFTECELDLPNEPVADVVKTYYERGIRIILLSGRDEVARAHTERWLQRYGIPYHELHMRRNKDSRKDAIVKRELYDAHVRDKYFVRFVLDDRNQVVNLWRLELGLPCFQVNYGDF